MSAQNRALASTGPPANAAMSGCAPVTKNGHRPAKGNEPVDRRAARSIWRKLMSFVLKTLDYHRGHFGAAASGTGTSKPFRVTDTMQ